MKKVIKLLNGKNPTFNEWRAENPTENIDLSYADLSGMNLSGKHLMNVNLANADLSNTICVSTIFCHANLENVNFKNADLSNASFGPLVKKDKKIGNSILGLHLFYAAKLSNANFENANMYFTNCMECDMDGANLTGAKTENANFNRAFWGGVLLTEN
jgi:uncharacterized protein YjbI with pentapeptide repeats